MRTGTRVVLISGNHDSARRLGFGAELIDAAGVTCAPTRDGSARRCCSPPDEHGPVAVYSLPYLEPGPRPRRAGSGERRSHAATLAAAMTRIRADLAGRPGTRSVVLAHAFVAGGLASESERDISVGGVSVVPTSCFDGVDYTALGHLHGAQALTETVRYSGSPIAYSFSEEHHRKAVLLVDVPTRPGRPVTAEALPRRPCRPVTAAVHRGHRRPAHGRQRWADYSDHYLQVTLTDAERPREAMARLRTRFPQTLVLVFEPESAADDEPSYAARLRGKSDLDVATDFVAHVRSTPDDDESALLARALSPSAGPTVVGLMHFCTPEHHGVRAVRRHAARRLRRARRGGLFLFHGPTGAEKTSILDAVCFRLVRPGAPKLEGRAGAPQRPRNPQYQARGRPRGDRRGSQRIRSTSRGVGAARSSAAPAPPASRRGCTCRSARLASRRPGQRPCRRTGRRRVDDAVGWTRPASRCGTCSAGR